MTQINADQKNQRHLRLSATSSKVGPLNHTTLIITVQSALGRTANILVRKPFSTR
jgi:hypothetical protein